LPFYLTAQFCILFAFETAATLQGGPKNGLFMTDDNFATVNGKKVRDMSKVSEFCLEKK